MVKPTMRWPWRCSNPATTELSTPPDMATATGDSFPAENSEMIGSGTGVSRRKFAQLRDGGGHGFDQRVHLLFIIRSPEGKTQAGASALRRQAHGQQHVRRFHGAA